LGSTHPTLIEDVEEVEGWVTGGACHLASERR
jgi:hypothetical protein